jgi:hypothetical protein
MARFADAFLALDTIKLAEPLERRQALPGRWRRLSKL